MIIVFSVCSKNIRQVITTKNPDMLTRNKICCGVQEDKWKNSSQLLNKYVFFIKVNFKFWHHKQSTEDLDEFT